MFTTPPPCHSPPPCFQQLCCNAIYPGRIYSASKASSKSPRFQRKTTLEQCTKFLGGVPALN
uniref:Uncharacterized protein n=1 Tax=Vitis vinifera TaxID=29760 RepID=F6H0M6_VITVI